MITFLHLIKYNFQFLVRNWVSKLLIILSLSIVAGGALYISNYLEDNIDIYKIDTSDSKINLDNLNILIKDLNIQLEEDFNSPDISVELNNNNIIISSQDSDIQYETLNNIALGIDHLLNEKAYNINISVAEVNNENKILSFIFTFILYLFTLFIGNMIITSISSEKTSKMLELISYKISSIQIIYAKIVALYIYLSLIIISCVGEVFLMNKLNIIDLKKLNDIFSRNNLSTESVIWIVISLIIGLIVYTQLYVISGSLVSDSSQLQLAQLPLTLISLVCYSINIYLITNTNSSSNLQNLGKFIPLLFPYSSIILIVQNNTINYNFFLQGFIVCLVFVVIVNWFLKKYILPAKMS